MSLYDRHYYYDDQMQPFQPRWDSRSMITTIIVINAALQILGLVLGRDQQLAQYLWLHPGDLVSPIHWYRFLTYGFVHSQDITHVLFNMLSLLFLGQVVEKKYGRWEFLRIYLISIVVCGVAWAMMRMLQQDTGTVLLGASGAVTTISMLFIFNYPNAVLRLWGILPVKAWVVGVLIIGGNFLGNSTVNANEALQVAYDVHLIGAAFGAIYYFSKLDFSRIENWISNRYGAFSKRNPKLKIHRSELVSDVSEKSQVEADRILDKIHREGQDSLTVKEREFLENYSRRLRKARSRSN